MKASKYGMFQAMGLCSKYFKMNEDERNSLRDVRLRNIVEWSRENSPYYARLYSSLGANYKLSDIPPINKLELMNNWNDWVTDRSLNLEAVNDFMQDIDNIGRKLNGNYLVFTTSGSTGNPLVAVCDKTTNNVMGAINAIRSFARKEDIKCFIKKGGKTIGVFATGGFYLGNSSVRSRQLSMPWKKRQMDVTSALLPIDEIVAKLNQFQPTMLGGYPSNLELLIDKKKSGELDISPVLIMTGGEYLSDTLRKSLSDAFGCYVQTSYSCTEGGTIACECTEQHFHINDDWVIVEPVDKENNPVPAGVQADKILLTNLFNYTQPFIRYEVTDRVILHNERCKCGNPSPWLQLEGRTDDVITFYSGKSEIKLPPLPIYAVLKEVHELQRFQLIAHSDGQFELRIEPVGDLNLRDAFLKAKAALEKHLLLHGITTVKIILSDKSPTQDAGSGKFKHIIQAKDCSTIHMKESEKQNV